MAVGADENIVKSDARKDSPPRVLIMSYAFPPLHVPMSPCVAKVAVGLADAGCATDILCAAPFDARLGWDASLLPFVRRANLAIRDLGPSPFRRLSGKVAARLGREPDPMHILGPAAEEAAERLQPWRYDAVVTFSPFHSINLVASRLKARHPEMRWVAQFSDPWSRNPIELSQRREQWNRRHEAEAIRRADRLIFTSPSARDLMLDELGDEVAAKASVLSHPWAQGLYPTTRAQRGETFTFCHIGTLFGRRSPDNLFNAARLVLERRPDLAGRFRFRLVGEVPRAMIETDAARALPPGMIERCGPVTYLQSLEHMAAADCLLLIEPDIAANIFVPSKLSDYVGSDRPVIALSPPGASAQLLDRLGLRRFQPSDVAAAADALEAAIDDRADDLGLRAAPAARKELESAQIAARYLAIIADAASRRDGKAA